MKILKNIFAFVTTKLFIKQVGLLILCYLLLIGGTLLYLDIRTHHGEKIAVPNIVGKHIDDIEDLLEESELDYIVLDSIYRPNVREGTIIKQNPEPTSRTKVFVKSSRIVEISLSKKINYVVVPDLLHKSKRYAESILKNRGLKFQVSFKISPNNIDAVISQKVKGRRIREGEKVPYGTVIHLIIGKASKEDPFEVPDLYGMTYTQADSVVYELPSVSLIIGDCAGCKTKKDTLRARISSQTPEFFKGNMRPPGSDIVIFLEKDFVDKRMETTDEE
jgi:beta-lactam-binding protein with PASTA domain